MRATNEDLARCVLPQVAASLTDGLTGQVPSRPQKRTHMLVMPVIFPARLTLCSCTLGDFYTVVPGIAADSN